MSEQSLCDNRGPRIGEDGTRCRRPSGHVGDHATALEDGFGDVRWTQWADPMTSVPPTQPPAAPESDVRLTEAERTDLAVAVHDTDAAGCSCEAVYAAVERIVAERVRVVEGETICSSAPAVDASTGTDAYRVSLNLTTGDIATTPAHLPAASTGTSEDVEALAKLLCATDPTSNEDTWLVVREGHREYRRDHAAAVLASDWLAAHDAATADRVRRETAEGIAQAIEGKCDDDPTRPRYTTANHAYVIAARIAREQAR